MIGVIMQPKRLSNIIGFDDAPFAPDHTGPVTVVGTVYAGLQFNGVIIGTVDKDGSDAAESLVRLVYDSKFAEYPQLIMLQGITMAGFNVVDLFYLHRELALPVLVVSRRLPDLAAIRKALLETGLPQGQHKWALIEQAGPMEPAGKAYVQRAGLSLAEAVAVVERFSIYGNLPEPLRTAHLIAGAIAEGQSRGKA